MRVENAEYRFCGQSFFVGRYCLHWHLHGTADSSYVRFNSIHDSFQRAVTVHGTESATVMGNFAYKVYGHTIFVEDGVERNNLIEGNLVAVTRATSAGLQGDTEPASFWAQTPANFWRHNVAAGSDSSGFWFELGGSPGGPSYSPYICPVDHQLGEVSACVYVEVQGLTW